MSTSVTRSDAPPQPPRLLGLVRHVARTPFGQDGPGERYTDRTPPPGLVPRQASPP
jgi:hypothetical protein